MSDQPTALQIRTRLQALELFFEYVAAQFHGAQEQAVSLGLPDSHYATSAQRQSLYNALRAAERMMSELDGLLQEMSQDLWQAMNFKESTKS